MGSGQSQQIVWGPTSLTVYYNEKKNKKIMFISDKHSIPANKPGISIGEMLNNVKEDKTVAFITEGCLTDLENENGNDNCMKRTQTQIVLQNKFSILWADFRYNLSSMLLEKNLTILSILSKKLLPVWNNNIQQQKDSDNNEIKKILTEKLEKAFAAYKQYFQTKNPIKEAILEYDGFQKLIEKLSPEDQKVIYSYINLHTIQNNSSDKFDNDFKQYKLDIIPVLKQFKLSLSGNIKIPSLSQLLKPIDTFRTELHKITNTMIESFIIATILSTNYDRYIVHAGAVHIINIEQFIVSIGYVKRYDAEQIGEQAIDISGLTFNN